MLHLLSGYFQSILIMLIFVQNVVVCGFSENSTVYDLLVLVMVTGLKIGAWSAEDLKHNRDIKMVLTVRQELHITCLRQHLIHFSLHYQIKREHGYRKVCLDFVL